MANTKIKEIVEFAAPEGIGAEDVLRGIHVLKAFYQQKEGFYGLEVGVEENGQWVLLLDWASVADERAASVAMMQSAETTAFKQVVDPKTVSKRLLELCSLA